MGLFNKLFSCCGSDQADGKGEKPKDRPVDLDVAATSNGTAEVKEEVLAVAQNTTVTHSAAPPQNHESPNGIIAIPATPTTPAVWAPMFDPAMAHEYAEHQRLQGGDVKAPTFSKVETKRISSADEAAAAAQKSPDAAASPDIVITEPPPGEGSVATATSDPSAAPAVSPEAAAESAVETQMSESQRTEPAEETQSAEDTSVQVEKDVEKARDSVAATTEDALPGVTAAKRGEEKAEDTDAIPPASVVYAEDSSANVAPKESEKAEDKDAIPPASVVYGGNSSASDTTKETNEDTEAIPPSSVVFGDSDQLDVKKGDSDETEAIPPASVVYGGDAVKVEDVNTEESSTK